MVFGAKYDQETKQLNFNFSVAQGNICYIVQCVFFGIAAVSMYMLYCESNVIDNKTLLLGSGTALDYFNLLFSSVVLLLLNETMFIPDRFRTICRLVAAYLVWNNMEYAACLAKMFYHDVDADADPSFTGAQVRIVRAGMFGVLASVVGAYLASFLVPNGREATSFSSYKFKKCILQSVFYVLAVAMLLVATFIQWSRHDTCAIGAYTNRNSTLLFVAFWVLFGLATNSSDSLDIAFAILSQQLVGSRPVSFNGTTETKLVAVYSLIVAAAFMMMLGSLLHAGIQLGGFTLQGLKERLMTKQFVILVISFILGIAGSACIFSKTKEHDELWVAFFAGWLAPILGLVAHVFDAESALVPALFFVPEAFKFYGASLVKSYGSQGYLTGYTRAGALLLMIAPFVSALIFYTSHIEVQSFDHYIRADGSATMKASMLLLLGSSLLWKASDAEFWALAFIAAVVFVGSYNPRRCLPKAGLLLVVQAACVPKLWLLANNKSLDSIPAVVVFIGIWMYISTFAGASDEVSTSIECIHEKDGDAAEGAGGAGGAQSPLIPNADRNQEGYAAVGEADPAPASSGDGAAAPAADSHHHNRPAPPPPAVMTPPNDS